MAQPTQPSAAQPQVPADEVDPPDPMGFGARAGFFAWGSLLALLAFVILVEFGFWQDGAFGPEATESQQERVRFFHFEGFPRLCWMAGFTFAFAGWWGTGFKARFNAASIIGLGIAAFGLLLWLAGLALG